MLNIIISGGSDGLGKEIAKKLSPKNKVIILSHNQEKLIAVSKEIGCDYVFADISDFSLISKAIDTVLQKYKKIDVLINNAGIWTEGNLEDNTPEKIKEIIEVNTLGTIFLTKAVIPSMKAQKNGRIINIISQDGLRSKKRRSVYSASKWAITGFTKCLQEDLSDFHIGVTGIYPGLMKSSLFEKQGVERDLKNSLELSEVSSLVEYVINLSADTLLPEISIKNIKNKTIMDDSNTSANDINLNPDMMTTQSSMPIMTPTQTSSNENTSDPLTHSDPGSKGVIDITPGATGDDHPSKVVDITPVDSVPSTNIEPTLPVAAPTSEPTPSLPPTPGEVSIPTAVTSPTTLDITPNSSEVETPNQVNPAFQDTHDDEFSSNSSGGHLADLASSAPAVTDPVAATTLTPSQPAISTENTTTTLPVTSPVETTPLTSSTTPTPVISDNPTPSSTTSAPAVEVSLPPAATASPFAEDPDGVKTNK